MKSGNEWGEGNYMEPRKRKTLLDLDRLPTQKELREFFLANDWSARKPYDFDKWSQEKIEDKSYSESIFNKIFSLLFI